MKTTALEIYKNKRSRKRFIYIDEVTDGQALFVTPARQNQAS